MKIPIGSFSQAEQVFDPLQEADCKSFCSWMRMRLRRRAQRSGWRDVHGGGQKEVFCLTAYKECSDIRSMMRFLHHQFKCSRQLKKNKMTRQTMHLLCWIQTWLCPLVSLLLLNLHCRRGSENVCWPLLVSTPAKDISTDHACVRREFLPHP